MLITLDRIIADFKLEIKGVLHIGAHYGEEYEDYIKAGVSNMIFFEPIKSNFDKLVKGAACRSYQIALGNYTGNKVMFVETANQGQSCSVLEPGTHLSSYPSIVFDKREIVAMDKLDNIAFNRADYNMINIDVQGYELEVFKGASETLKHIDIIYTEVNFNEVYKDCCLITSLDNHLAEYGFKRVLTDSSPGTWGDALYLK
jgi:FkbM family methyltransferase